MKFLVVIFSVLNFHSAMAQVPVKVTPPKKSLTLEAYLEQVRTMNPEAKALVESVQQSHLRLDEAEVSLSSELYGSYKVTDDRNEPTNPVAPPRTQSTAWRAGVRDKTKWGLSTDVYYDTGHSTYLGANPQFFRLTDFYDTRLGIDLKQSLWRNSFGQATRAEVEAQRAASRIEFLKQKYALKNLMTKAENTYWSLVSYGEVVKLQEDNVERARKLRDFMRRRAGLRLVDDVDALQAQASLESRELELLQSRDEQEVLRRQFNTLRGNATDNVSDLAELPASEFLLRTVKDPNQRMTREDFRMLYEQARMNAAGGVAARSRIAPELDLVATFAANGLDADSADSTRESTQEFAHPSLSVGVTFSIPLDYSLIGNMRRSYKAQERAAVAQKESAAFAEQRAWDDILKQKSEAQNRFEKALSLEAVQTKLVKRERQRLLNGRTTTFQAITFEQNLAVAQIQRVRLQLALLQVHNLLKQFEANL